MRVRDLKLPLDIEEVKEFKDGWHGKKVCEAEFVNQSIIFKFYDLMWQKGEFPYCFISVEMPYFDDTKPAPYTLSWCNCGKHRVEFADVIVLEDTLGCGSDETRNGLNVKIWEKN